MVSGKVGVVILVVAVVAFLAAGGGKLSLVALDNAKKFIKDARTKVDEKTSNLKKELEET